MHPENLSHPRGCGPHSRQPQHGPVTWGAGSPHVALRAGEDGGQMVTAALFITAKQKPAWENERACPATTRVHTEAEQLLRFPGLTEAWSKRRPFHKELQLMGKNNIKLIKETRVQSSERKT